MELEFVRWNKLSDRNKEAYRAIDRAINTLNYDSIKDLANVMAFQTHRTLQQNFMRLLLEFVRLNAMKLEIESEYGRIFYDDRNKATVELCSVIWESLKSTDYYCKCKGDVLLPTI